jgi:heme oxygenase
VTAKKLDPRMKLRAATRIHHGRVDQLFGRFDLSELGHYRRFLMIQAAAFIPTEQALDRDGAGALVADWAQRRRSSLLLADLADLDAEPDESLTPPVFASEAALLGGLYVLEGSRLGAAVLKRSVPQAAPARFLGASSAPGAWPQLVALINERLHQPEPLGEATAAARAIFDIFEQAGRREP